VIKPDFFFGVIALIGCGYLLLRKLRKGAAQSAARTEGLFRDVVSLFEGPVSKSGDAAGTWIVAGRYNGAPFQLRSVIDTLATRKLPSLWLQVTLQRPQPLATVLDIMRRPNGATTFSNFDFLSYTQASPTSFPEDAVMRSDAAELPAGVSDVLSRHSSLIAISRAKELLISPNGLRLVLQIAEGDRLRHGVFRQADFEDALIDPILISKVMDGLLALETDLREHLQHG
jgi:hypothetical protein